MLYFCFVLCSSVCKSCIVKFLEDHNTCPKCNLVIHQSYPKNYIRYTELSVIIYVRVHLGSCVYFRSVSSDNKDLVGKEICMVSCLFAFW